jgi:hypothetical protein
LELLSSKLRYGLVEIEIGMNDSGPSCAAFHVLAGNINWSGASSTIDGKYAIVRMKWIPSEAYIQNGLDWYAAGKAHFIAYYSYLRETNPLVNAYYDYFRRNQPVDEITYLELYNKGVAGKFALFI